MPYTLDRLREASANLPLPARLQGSGPFGLILPTDVTAVMGSMREAALALWPRLQHVMAQPAAAEVVNTLSMQMGRRFAARTIKFLLAPAAAATQPPPPLQQQQQQARGAGSSMGGGGGSSSSSSGGSGMRGPGQGGLGSGSSGGRGQGAGAGGGQMAAPLKTPSFPMRSMPLPAGGGEGGRVGGPLAADGGGGGGGGSGSSTASGTGSSGRQQPLVPSTAPPDSRQ